MKYKFILPTLKFIWRPRNINAIGGSPFPNFKRLISSSSSSLLLITGRVPPACLHNVEASIQDFLVEDGE